MTSKLLPRFKTRIGRFTLMPSKGGCFELKVGNKLLYSKLQTGSFPNEETLLAEVAKILDA